MESLQSESPTATLQSAELNDYPDYFPTIISIVAAFLISSHPFINSFINNKIRSNMSKSRGPERIRLEKEASRLRAELNAISPTDEFASYSKKQREFNKAMDALQAIANEDRHNAPAVEQKIVAVRVVSHITGILLLHQVSGIVAFCIPSNMFFPFNYFLRFPAIWAGDSCGAGTDFIPVSQFVVSYIFMFIIRRALQLQS